jgi:hypothetical protein
LRADMVKGGGELTLSMCRCDSGKHVEAGSKPSPTGSDGSVCEGVVGKRVLG